MERRGERGRYSKYLCQSHLHPIQGAGKTTAQSTSWRSTAPSPWNHLLQKYRYSTTVLEKYSTCPPGGEQHHFWEGL
jgi:hypothetical protein